MKNLPPKYPYLVVDASGQKPSTTAMIANFTKPEKLITTKRNLENFLILHDHQLWHKNYSFGMRKSITVSF